MNTLIRYQACLPINGNPSRLQVMDSGNCLAYVPEVVGSSSFKPHVTLDLGHSVLMLDLADFKKLAQRVLNVPYKDNIISLRLVKQKES